MACLSSSQLQLAPQGIRAKLSNYFRTHTALHTKISVSLIWCARNATFLVPASDQRILGRVKCFMKLTFLETEMLCLYLAGNLLHLHSSIAIFSSSTTEMKLINKLGWPLCQFSYSSNPYFSQQFANISPVKKVRNSIQNNFSILRFPSWCLLLAELCMVEERYPGEICCLISFESKSTKDMWHN